LFVQQLQIPFKWLSPTVKSASLTWLFKS